MTKAPSPSGPFLQRLELQLTEVMKILDAHVVRFETWLHGECAVFVRYR
jgi:hypothetical protein